jgi:hypothetical protein
MKVYENICECGKGSGGGVSNNNNIINGRKTVKTIIVVELKFIAHIMKHKNCKIFPHRIMFFLCTSFML